MSHLRNNWCNFIINHLLLVDLLMQVDCQWFRWSSVDNRNNKPLFVNIMACILFRHCRGVSSDDSEMISGLEHFLNLIQS